MKFEMTWENPNKKISHTSEEESLSEILKDFEDFLKGCGFHFTGHLDIIEEEE